MLSKAVSNTYKANILLLPLLVVMYFWGILYFTAFAAFVIICNISFTKNYLSLTYGLTQNKIVITGTVTDVRKDDETIVSIGDNDFDITYANADFIIKSGDKVAIHFSKKQNNSRGQLLTIQMAG